MIEIIRTFYGTTMHYGADCKVVMKPAYRCTVCGLIGFKRDDMVYHNCKENTNEVPVADFRGPIDGVRLEP